MNWKLIPLIGVVVWILSHSSAIAAAHPLQYGKAALVNGAVITREDFYSEFQRVERLRGENKKAPEPAETARDKKQALENLIARELLYQEAEKRGIRVPDKVVEEEVDRLRKQFPKETDFKATLGKMGLSESAVNAQVKRGIAIQRYIDDEFAKKVQIADEEVDSYYESHRTDLKEPLASAREKVRQILRREEAAKKLPGYLKGLREKAVVEILLNEDGE